MQFVLLVAYSLLAILHLASLLLNIKVLMDFDLNLIKAAQTMISLATSVPLFLSDVLTLLILGKSISNNYRTVVEYMEAFACFLFICLTVHLTNSKLLQLLKGFAKAYYYALLKYIVFKLIFLLVFFYVGLVLCYLSSSEYLSFFTTLYYNVVSMSNFIYLLAYRQKMMEFKIGTSPVNPSSEGKIAIFVKKTKVNLPTEENDVASVKSTGVEYDNAFLEVNSTYKGGSIIAFFNIVSSLILLCVFRQSSFENGRIITIPWKISIGVGLCVFASIFLKQSA